MLIELITPLMIATAPTMVIVQNSEKYNHETQIVARANGNDVIEYTSSGTRTYDFRGSPNDSDND
jgi:hypothetical protein